MNSTRHSDAPLRCPKCGSTDIAEIVYNPAAMDEELLRRVQAKRAVLRTGAQIKPAPRYHCNYCDYEW
ncbi:MAG: hypothetical protein GX298_11715 [Planctomycetes bacterium]|nr:hypothetical protein [Planctomycetota bacterium]